MITLLSNSNTGVCEYSISKIEELESISKTGVAPTSTAMLIEDDGLRVFLLNGDRTKWIEL